MPTSYQIYILSYKFRFVTPFTTNSIPHPAEYFNLIFLYPYHYLPKYPELILSPPLVSRTSVETAINWPVIVSWYFLLLKSFAPAVTCLSEKIAFQLLNISIWTILCDLTFDYLHKTAISQFYRRESRIELFIYRITPPKNKSSYIRCSCPIRLSAYWISTENAVKALTDSGMITKFARMYQGTAWHFHANCWFRRH